MDNQPRVPDSQYYHQHWSWVDASAQACLNAFVLEQIASTLSQSELVSELTADRTQLTQLINEQMWHGEGKFYQDVSANGRFSKVKSIGAYWALLDGALVPEKRREPFIQHLRDQWAFKLPHRIVQIRVHEVRRPALLLARVITQLDDLIVLRRLIPPGEIVLYKGITHPDIWVRGTHRHLEFTGVLPVQLPGNHGHNCDIPSTQIVL